MRKSVTDYFASVHHGRSKWWEWIIGIALIVGFYLAVTFILYAFAYSMAPEIVDTGIWAYALLLISFPPLFFGIFLVQKFWHQRRRLALLTSDTSFRWIYFRRGIIVYTALMVFDVVFFSGKP